MNPMRTTIVILPALLATLAMLPSLAGQNPVPSTVEFNRDIRPILSDNCFNCHGPDKSNRKSKLRLDVEADAFADRGGYHALVAGKPDQSELVQRITAKNVKERMPPIASGHKLTPGQIELIRAWIMQGAKWQKHWSLLPPRRPDLPAVKNQTWPRNGIDYFVLARLEAAGLKPSAEADRITLLRRVTLDLTGLPPTPAQVDAFLADTSPDAYGKVVDRLLQSPRYGERMALPWLNAARYADTNGYQTDGERNMWRWRDWVIEAFNQNMPFDQFTIQQLAGDLLPKPTLEQRIATGFNRNHRGNSEGGVIPEEYAVEYVVDRVDTTSTVWLGLTMGCVRCHDHKYDPLTQKEFYQLFAYFNNVPEKGKAIKYGNSPPYIKAPTRDQAGRQADLAAQLKQAEAACAALEKELLEGLSRWEKNLPKIPELQDIVSIRAGLSAHYHLDGNLRDKTGKHETAKYIGQNGSHLSHLGQGLWLDGTDHVECGNVGKFGFFDRFSIAAGVSLSDDRKGSIVSRMQDTGRAEGYNVAVQNGAIHVHFVKRWLDDAIRVETVEKLKKNRWYQVLVTYDGSRVADGIKIYIDGEPAKIKVNLDDLNQSFATNAPFRIGRGGGANSSLDGYVSDVRLYNRALTADEAAIIANYARIPDIAKLRPAKRTRADQLKLRWFYLRHGAPEQIKKAHQRLDELRKKYAELDDEIPTTMVMEEMATPRDTHVLVRGDYDKKGEKVQPGIPASLPSLPSGVPNNRLGLAKWLVDRANPLTARVAVNRFWQTYFGTGLVKSLEDFGNQGDWPSHPDLLDWLATEFVKTWDVKAFQRLIVTSATYRQSSKVTKELLQRDPDNRLLGRGPRVRLSAETIRDQALFASGLLVEEVGGPSVKPYQPAGLWRELAGERYPQDKGAKLYRRSLYTFWKRTIPPPAMMTFDAAGRETCVVRETRTNTPLQALNLLNDVTYVEAARVLAQRMLLEGDVTVDVRLTRLFRLATCRAPRPAELRILRDGFEAHLANYRADPQAAANLLAVGEYPRAKQLDVSELAAYSAVAGLILNLDEAITKE
jgi:hypothetical protein